MTDDTEEETKTDIGISEQISAKEMSYKYLYVCGGIFPRADSTCRPPYQGSASGLLLSLSVLRLRAWTGPFERTRNSASVVAAVVQPISAIQGLRLLKATSQFN